MNESDVIPGLLFRGEKAIDFLDRNVPQLIIELKARAKTIPLFDDGCVCVASEMFDETNAHFCFVIYHHYEEESKSFFECLLFDNAPKNSQRHLDIFEALKGFSKTGEFHHEAD